MAVVDRDQIDGEQIIERYLANQLSPTVVQDFEAHYAKHPRVVRDIELVLRLKEGLATLADRGEFDGLRSR